MRYLQALLVVAIVHATVAVALPCAAHPQPAHAGGPCHESRAPAPPEHGGSCPALACPAGPTVAVLPPLVAAALAFEPPHRVANPPSQILHTSVSLTIDPPPPRG